MTAFPIDPGRILALPTAGLILGIDPGKHGALALMTGDGAIVELVDMPDATGAALGAHLADLIDDIQPDQITEAWVEKVGYMPGQRGVWTFAEGHGAVLGALGMARIPVHLVTAAVWKKNQGVTKDKGTSRQKATELWPAEASRFARVKDDGRAEAALIARYGRQQGADR